LNKPNTIHIKWN